MKEMNLSQTSPHYTTFLPTVHSIQRFARFATVGLLGTFIDLVLFLVLRTWFSWPTLLANICHYLCRFSDFNRQERQERQEVPFCQCAFLLILIIFSLTEQEKVQG